MNFINDNISIDFEVSKDILEKMKECEQFDKDNNYGAYESFASFLVYVLCKEAYSQNHLTKKQWEIIEQRYQL